MTTQGHSSGQSKRRAHNVAARAISPQDDERSFADMRRTLHGVLHLLTIHRWAFLVPCCVVSGSVFLLSLSYPRSYTAAASFERRVDPIMDDLPTPAIAEAYDYLRTTMVRDMRSVEQMVGVVDRLGLTESLARNPDGTFTEAAKEKRDSIARALGGTIRVTTKTQSPHVDLMRVTYNGRDPDIGWRLVNEMKETYVGQAHKWMTQYLQSKYDYFSQQAAAAMEQVNAATRAQTEQYLAHPHFDPRDPGAIVTRIDQLELERRELLLRKREHDEQLRIERQVLVTLEHGILPTQDRANRAAQMGAERPWGARALALRTRVNDLTAEIEERRVLRGMTDQHPEIKERLTERDWLEQSLARQLTADRSPAPNAAVEVAEPSALPSSGMNPINPQRVRLDLQIAGLEAKIRELDISLNTNEQTLARLREGKTLIHQKQQEFASLQANLDKTRTRHSRLEAVLAAIEPALDAVKERRLLRFVQTQRAHGGSNPVSPKTSFVLLLAGLAGLAVGVLGVVLAEVFDHLYRSSAQVARGLGLPILEAIDEIVTAQARRRGVLRHAVIIPVVLFVLLGFTGTAGSLAYLSLERPATYEKIRQLPDRAYRILAGDSADQDVAATAEAS